MQSTAHRRSSTFNATAPTSLKGFTGDLFSDSRNHGYQGPIRHVRLNRATTSGGGTIAKSEDGVRCVVAGRESLRILRLSDPDETPTAEHKSSIGRGGHRIDSSRNLWEGSGLKIDSASTDVAWCYNNKILTSARNGDLIMWDLNKSGSTKYERKTKNHIRSIHKLSCSSIVPYYCVTGSADGDMRVWDLRDMTRSLMKIHHPTSVRSLVFSPCLSHPLQAVVGLDNGSIYRWDLQMGQRGQLDRLPVAHTSAILALDWCSTTGASGATDDLGSPMDRSFIVSGGLDHTVKVWDLSGSSTSSHIAHKPTYTLHPSYPVRRVLWRPDYPCELALVSNAEFGGGSGAELLASPRMQNASTAFLSATTPGVETKDKNSGAGSAGDAVEIWDVRRAWIAKWTVPASISEGGVTDTAFRDSHALLVQHSSGSFAQIDLRQSARPIDAIPRVALSWNAADGADGALAFVADKRARWEVPYDDIHPDKRPLLPERKLKPKALGDKGRVPGLQNMGTYVRAPQSENTETDLFGRLAKGYVIPKQPAQRREACSLNAEIALEAGNIHAAQVWILLGSLLTDVVPESITSSLPMVAKTTQPIPLTHSISAPAALPTVGSLSSHASGSTSKPASNRATSSDSQPQRHHSDAQPPKPTKPPPNSRNLTPASSASSSPRHIPISLPPTPALPPTTTMTPTTATPRKSSVLVPTTSLAHSHVRRPSVYSRTSAVPSMHSESPSAASASDKSLRHVGEGALDDSDSSEADAGGSDGAVESQSEIDHTENAAAVRPIMTKSRSLSLGRAGPAHPSPLSRLAGQHRWTEEEDEEGKGRDEEDEASPSPGSTDTDGEHSEDESDTEAKRRIVRVKANSASRSRSRKNSNAKRMKSRSRSSTVASLAAPLLSPTVSSPPAPSAPPGSPQQSRAVVRRGSQSSVQTVIAGSIRDQEHDVAAKDSEQNPGGHEQEPENWSEMSDQRKVTVTKEEHQLHKAGWRALQDALEEYADEGDIQMCAMLSLIAPKELNIELGRTVQFVEAYIDLLMRYRLHTSAAYLRKYSKVEEVQKMTGLETIIYTACGRCRKPVISLRSRNALVKGTYAICATCKAAVVRCSICHLPVRNLLFQCSVCSHGGHQECYRRYYMERPMIELQAPRASAARGRQLQRNQDGEHDPGDGGGLIDRMGERNMAGHACAAGCGHFCWAAIGRSTSGEGHDEPRTIS
ncbi:hypothetical protein HYDPIDRAFT_97184 [Hydnomerulius pinastri MD-312]|uniref:Restriction of telomere capping protein 1 n=1 Tax=Hydnomerulius pinastri MD-312 TaxID=994086 RepID=A0A0C9W408_9AGAM|nr:hypothetical protein HYDPIDRAFT_97184 [Hydnomerulius pinastri MD-312]